MRTMIFLLAIASCSFPEPARAPDDATVPDAPPDAPGTDDFTGAISVTGGVMQAGTIAVIDDGIEGADAACNEQICTTGGIAP
jgi:hypothetical protein